MSYEKTTWAAGDKVTSAKLNNIENGILTADEGLSQLNETVNGLSASVGNAATAASVAELSNTVSSNSEAISTNTADIASHTQAIDGVSVSLGTLSNQVAQNADVINNNASLIDENSLDIDLLFDKVAVLEEKVDALRKTNVVPKAVAANEFASGGAKATDNSLVVNAADQDVVITLDEPMNNQFLNVVAQSVTAKDMEMESSKFNANVEGDISITGLTTSGSLPKATSNSMMSFESPEYVTIKDSALGESGYNCVEIGLSKTAGGTPIVPKGILIENIEFSGTCSNNAISVFGAQDNAIITVKDCTFTKVSNAFRWSNKTNSTGVVINFINCNFMDVDDDPQWHAAFLCQDYTSSTAELVEFNNLFAPEKLTINFINCEFEGQPMVQPEDPSTVWNSSTDKQIAVICLDRGAQYIPTYDANKFPVINIR